MPETFTALLLAHVLADFVLQTNRMATAKHARHPGWMAAHIGIVGVTAAAALGDLGWPVLALMAAHLAIDLAKTFAPARLGPFLIDQAAHLISLAAIAAWQSDLWATGYWAQHAWLPGTFAAVGGLILTTRVGGFAIGFLMEPFSVSDQPSGLPNGGKVIGLLERGLIFLFVMVGQPTGIGFLIAAKSVLRFDTASGNQKAAEYVIIGTLASFGWALLASYGTVALLQHLPALGIPLESP